MAIINARRMSMKGQALVFERVLLFAISVVIFIVCFSIFIFYQNYYVEIGSGDHFTMVGNQIKQGIIDAVKTGNDAETSINVKIPGRVGNEEYYLKLRDGAENAENAENAKNGLFITTAFSGREAQFNLYGIADDYNLGGEKILSTGGEVLIYKKGNEILLL